MRSTLFSIALLATSSGAFPLSSSNNVAILQARQWQTAARPATCPYSPATCANRQTVAFCDAAYRLTPLSNMPAVCQRGRGSSIYQPLAQPSWPIIAGAPRPPATAPVLIPGLTDLDEEDPIPGAQPLGVSGSGVFGSLPVFQAQAGDVVPEEFDDEDGNMPYVSGEATYEPPIAPYQPPPPPPPPSRPTPTPSRPRPRPTPTRRPRPNRDDEDEDNDYEEDDDDKRLS